MKSAILLSEGGRMKNKYGYYEKEEDDLITQEYRTGKTAYTGLLLILGCILAGLMIYIISGHFHDLHHLYSLLVVISIGLVSIVIDHYLHQRKSKD